LTNCAGGGIMEIWGFARETPPPAHVNKKIGFSAYFLPRKPTNFLNHLNHFLPF